MHNTQIVRRGLFSVCIGISSFCFSFALFVGSMAFRMFTINDFSYNHTLPLGNGTVDSLRPNASGK